MTYAKGQGWGVDLDVGPPPRVHCLAPGAGFPTRCVEWEASVGPRMGGASDLDVGLGEFGEVEGGVETLADAVHGGEGPEDEREGGREPEHLRLRQRLGGGATGGSGIRQRSALVGGGVGENGRGTGGLAFASALEGGEGQGQGRRKSAGGWEEDGQWQNLNS